MLTDEEKLERSIQQIKEKNDREEYIVVEYMRKNNGCIEGEMARRYLPTIRRLWAKNKLAPVDDMMWKLLK